MSDHEYRRMAHRNATPEDLRTVGRLMELAATVAGVRVEAMRLLTEAAERHGYQHGADDLIEGGVFSLDTVEAFESIFAASDTARMPDGTLVFRADTTSDDVPLTPIYTELLNLSHPVPDADPALLPAFLEIGESFVPIEAASEEQIRRSAATHREIASRHVFLGHKLDAYADERRA